MLRFLINQNFLEAVTYLELGQELVLGLLVHPESGVEVSWWVRKVNKLTFDYKNWPEFLPR